MSILDKVTSKLPGRGDDADYYLALLITYRGVETALWKIDDDHLAIVATAKTSFKDGGNILETAAEAIDSTCEPRGIDVKEVILGLPDSWISQNQILPQYFEKLNELAKNLDLTPFAFVALNHAVANRLKILYGTLFSGYLLNIDNENITLSSIVSGQLRETRFIKSNHGEFEGSIQKLFAHFANSPMVDSAIYVYGSPIPAEIDQVLQNMAIFAGRAPAVKRLNDAFANHAIALAGAVDRGNVQGIHVEDSKEDENQSVPEVMTQSVTPAPIDASVPTNAPTIEQSDNLIPIEMAATPNPPVEALHIMPQEQSHPNDIPQEQENDQSLPEGFSVAAQEQPDQLHAYAQAGVPIVEPVIHKTEQPPPTAAADHPMPLHAVPEPPQTSFPAIQNTPHFSQVQQVTSPVIHPNLVETPAKQGFGPGTIIGKMRALIPSLPLGSTRPKLAGAGGIVHLIFGKGILFIVPILLVVAMIVAYFTLVKAEVTIAFTPKNSDGSKTITVSQKISTVDLANAILPGSLQSTDVSGSAKGTATGKKKVGDKAKGSVTVYNKTTADKTLAAGTILNANNFAFTVDQAASVPAETVTDSTDTDGTPITISKPGKATVAITAQDIGTDQNLPSGTSFIIKGQTKDTMYATASAALAGGTSRDVTVVSDADVKQAEQSLIQSLKDQAKASVVNKAGDHQKVIDESVAVSISKKSTDKKVGDEAQTFTLNETATAQAMLYSLDDLNALMQQAVKAQKPDGYDLVPGDIQQPTYKSTDKSGQILLDWHYQARLIPSVNVDQLKDQIKGKRASAAITQLSKLTDVAQVSITLSPKPAEIINYLPFRTSHITITSIAAQ